MPTGRGVAWGATGTCVGAMGTPGAPRCPRNAGKASCWLNLNTALLREQLLSIRSKRKKLGEELGGGGGKGALGVSQGPMLWSGVVMGVVMCSLQSCGTEHRPGRGTWVTRWPCWASWH